MRRVGKLISLMCSLFASSQSVAAEQFALAWSVPRQFALLANCTPWSTISNPPWLVITPYPPFKLFQTIFRLLLHLQFWPYSSVPSKVYRASWWKKPRLQQQSWSNINVVFYLILVLGSPVKNASLRFAFVQIGTCRERLGGSQGRSQSDMVEDIPPHTR